MTSGVIYSANCQICEGMQDLLVISDEEHVQILKKVKAVTNLEDQTSKWLRLICVICKMKLDELWEFKMLCQKAYLNFLQEVNARNVKTNGASNDLCIESDQEAQEVIEWLVEIEEECNETEKSHQENEMIEILYLDDSDEENEESQEVKDASEDLESESNERERLEFDQRPEKASHCLKKKNPDGTPKEKRTRRPRNTNPRPKPSYVCDVCKKTFPMKRQLTMHINLKHFNVKKFQCHICGKQFRINGHLRSHLQTHSDEKIRCVICNKSYNTDITFRIHFTKYHAETPKTYKCSFCPKEFRIREHRTNHVRLHTGEKPYKCSMCPKTFRVRKNLKNHINTHTREKTWPCEFCKKEFTTSENMKVHKRIHTGEKPYKCLNCSERFRELKMFKNHRKKCSEISENEEEEENKI